MQRGGPRNGHAEVKGTGRRSRRRSNTRKSGELRDSSGETGLVVRTLAARGPDCESSRARPGASSSRRMARSQNSSTVREAGRCHPRVRSAESSSRDTGGTAESRASHAGAWKPVACRDAVASFKAAYRQPRREAKARGHPENTRGLERRHGLDARGLGARRPKMPKTPRRHGARRCGVQVHRGATRAVHVRQPKQASRKQCQHAAGNPGKRGWQHHVQRRMLVCPQVAVCAARTAHEGPHRKTTTAMQPECRQGVIDGQ